MESLTGYIERIVYYGQENGFTVAVLVPSGAAKPVHIVGTMPSLQPGETISCQGSWRNHASHGKQFSVDNYTVQAPADLVGLQRYLESGLIKGIGKVYAKRIIAQFKDKTLEVIDTAPHRLIEVAGIGKQRSQTIIESWNAQKAIRTVMIFLQGYGISPAHAHRIYKKYGDKSIEKLQADPYILAREVKGFGFKTADTIAHKMGIEPDAPQRLDAGILYTLSECAGEGNVCYPVSTLVEAAQMILEVSSTAIQARLAFLQAEESIVLRDLLFEGELTPFAWLKALSVAEDGIANELGRLAAGKSQIRSINTEKAIEWVQEQLNLTLAEQQVHAVGEATHKKLHIITGGPGTGKSTITNAILAIMSKLTPNILLAAPTGRAAKRMEEITGYQAKTIHSLLEYDFKKRGFRYNREEPLDCDLLVVDEASMIDTHLMYHLLRAIPTRSHVVFVGDIDQLPSVGPGNVLRDFIRSSTLSVTQLTEIFRQAAGSKIVVHAHQINKGQFPVITNEEEDDFFFQSLEEPEQILQSILHLVATRLTRRYGFHPMRDIQVLAPMKKGVIGIDNLNTVLQKTLNDQSEALLIYGNRFTLGDKVMQIRNNYQKEVLNGDIGEIIHLDVRSSAVKVRYPHKEVEYEGSALDELVLAYAVSIHKYQGSECPCVVIPIHTSHFKLLYRNLIYTGITRGKKLVVLVGSKKALSIAVRNDEVKRRYTGLRTALLEIMAAEQSSCLPI